MTDVLSPGQVDALNGGWEIPLPLLGSSSLPTFPVGSLPPWLASFVTGLARGTQTPVDLPGVMVLGALAAAAGGRAVVEARPGWREPCNLFLGCAMPPGNRKSAVAQTVTAPLHAGEKAETERMKEEIARMATQREIADSRARQATATAAKADDDEAEQLREAAVEAAALAEAIVVPTMPRLLADDATPEALASLMATQHGRIALISAEGGPFDQMAGRYSKFPNLDVYLKGHAGDHLRIDRKGQGPEFIESPALSVCVCFQPAVLPMLALREGFRARGLLARFMFSVPHSFVGRRKIGEPPVDEDVADRYEADLKTLVLTLAEWIDPCVLTLSQGANVRLLAIEREIERQLVPDGALGALADWGSKLAGAIVRISGLLHLAGNMKTGFREPIKVETLDAAAAIGNYFRAHAIAAHTIMGEGTASGDARVLLDWLGSTRPKTFTRRDAHRAHQTRFPRAADLDPALEVLEAHGWVRRRPEDPSRPQGGRPPSPSFEAHPELVDGSLRTC